MNKNYIIALDLDETLLNSEKKISEKNLDCLKKCKEKGFIIVISSARGYSSCKKVAEQISADYVCCQIGNMIVNSHGDVVYENGFKQSDISDFIDTFSQYTNNFLIDSTKNLYAVVKDDFSKAWGAEYCNLDDLRQFECFKLFIHYEDHYKNYIEEYCKKHDFIYMTMRTDPYFLISPAKSDKYLAIEKLLELINSDLDHLIVFGDDNSDLLSIQKAKYGVAVANSRKSVLNAAKYITLSNNEDGIAHFMEKFLNNSIQ